MSKLKIFYDDKGKTLNVWFDDPKKEVVSEEVGDGVILSKDKKGEVIGFEKLYVNLPKKMETNPVPVEFNFPQPQLPVPSPLSEAQTLLTHLYLVVGGGELTVTVGQSAQSRISDWLPEVMVTEAV